MLRWPNLVGALVVLVVLSMAGTSVYNAYRQAGKFRAEVTRREKAEFDLSEYIRTDKANDARRDAASQGYQNELTALRSSNARSFVPVVRLCPQPAKPAAAPIPASGPETAAAPAGLVPPDTGLHPRPGPDIGPELRALLVRAEEVSAQLRAVLTLEGEPDGIH